MDLRIIVDRYPTAYSKSYDFSFTVQFSNCL
jgi:hypothetical protein